MKKPFWKRTRVHRDPETGHRVVTLTAMVDGLRVWCEEHWNDEGFPDRDLVLVHEAYWTNSDPTRRRTLEEVLEREPAPQT